MNYWPCFTRFLKFKSVTIYVKLVPGLLLPLLPTMCPKQWALTKIPNRTAKTNRLWTVSHCPVFNSSGISQWVYWLTLFVQHFHFIDIRKIILGIKENLSIHKSQGNQAGCASEAAVVSGLILHICVLLSCFCSVIPVLVASLTLEVLPGFYFCSSPAVLLPFWATGWNIRKK